LSRCDVKYKANMRFGFERAKGVAAMQERR